MSKKNKGNREMARMANETKKYQELVVQNQMKIAASCAHVDEHGQSIVQPYSDNKTKTISGGRYYKQCPRCMVIFTQENFTPDVLEQATFVVQSAIEQIRTAMALGRNSSEISDEVYEIMQNLGALSQGVRLTGAQYQSTFRVNKHHNHQHRQTNSWGIKSILD